MRSHIVALWIAILFLAAGSLYAVIQGEQGRTDIQASRLAACRATNDRHDASILFLSNLAKKQEKGQSPAKVKAIQKSLGLYRILIQDEVPKQNCSTIVNHK